MAQDPAATIQAATRAYIDGEQSDLQAQLHDSVALFGSHQGDYWSGDGPVVAGLSGELRRHRGRDQASRPGGRLVQLALAASGIKRDGDVAWWSASGSLIIDDKVFDEASWSVVLQKFAPDADKHDGPWQIVHSHFTIHHNDASEAALAPPAAS